MKRLVSFVLIVLLLLCTVSCARKTKPAFEIKHESVTSLDFKMSKTELITAKDLKCTQKSVTQKQDIEKLLCWLESLKLQKHTAIEIPIEQIEFVIVLNGVKTHKVIFIDDFVVFDSAAFAYVNKADKDQVVEKYNLLNYPEINTNLDII